MKAWGPKHDGYMSKNSPNYPLKSAHVYVVDSVIPHK